MSTMQRIPGVLAAIRRDYETLGHSTRLLSRRYGVPASTIALNAKSHGWVKARVEPAPSPGVLSGATGARDVETAILAQGLRRQPYRRGQMPPNPAMRQPAEPGVPANALVGDLPSSDQKMTDPAADLPPAGAQANSDELARAPTCARPADQSSEPAAEGPNRLQPRAKRAIQTADVINFPRVAAPSPKQAGAVQVLPTTCREEKAQLRVTLATIRAMMSLEQVEQLEHHRALLRRYSHLIEVYLEPQRFVELEGLDDEAKAAKIVATQKLALGLLLPTERDTLAGAIRTLTGAIRDNIELARMVASLDKVKAGVISQTEDPAGHAGAVLVNLDAMGTGQLRQVQRAMELLQKHQREAREAPRPPPPEPIDDLVDGQDRQCEDQSGAGPAYPGDDQQG
jgi:hypothetical protein